MSRTTTQERGKQAYMSIINGKWAEKVESSTPNAVERTNKKDVLVHELLYDDVSGVIKSMSIEKKEFGKQLNVLIDDVGEAFTLSIPVESKYFDAFCNKIANADLTKEVKLSPYSFIPTGETNAKTGINIYQPGNSKAVGQDGKVDPKGKLPYFFTKENPNGRPQPHKDGKPLAAGETMEDEEWKAYFLQISLFNQKFIEKIAPKDAGSVKKAEDALPNAPAKDDLPF